MRVLNICLPLLLFFTVSYSIINRAVVSGGAGGTLAPPEFGYYVNPIPTRGADYAHNILLLAPPDSKT